MSTIFTLFMVIIMIACVLLITIIMAQNPKGGGLSGTFGGTSPAQFGVQRTNDFMENATWVLGGGIIFLIIVSVVLTAKPSQSVAPQVPVNQSAPASKTPVPNSTPMPQAPVKK